MNEKPNTFFERENYSIDEELRRKIRGMRDRRYASVYKKKVREEAAKKRRMK